MTAPTLQHTRLEGIREYTQAIDTVLQLARRTIRIFERDLDGIGFNSPQRQDLLRGFLLASRVNRLHVVVHDTGYLESRCPRVIHLLRQFSHGMQIHRTRPHAKSACDPMIIADDQHYLHRFHYDDSRALLGLYDPQGAHDLAQRFEELWEASEPGICATVLGL